eukprot:CAMPEP_0196591010 /NCGR_PEP_ID=MMETSP1081-20130531/68234_1 /TAXON_ID=36882 /ORGANISM="Pyramimonas amylifera, Strain CCMP720" /LENGTH=178 /DNA_ID=CAMNT_0041914259 /DNA_START=282 /DNA_END=818 /DNA_ORIENTATION=-
MTDVMNDNANIYVSNRQVRLLAFQDNSSSNKSNGLNIEANCDPVVGTISGLWIGEAIPHDSFIEDGVEIPTNPIKWSLCLMPSNDEFPSAFGAGYFADSGDIDENPVLFYTLRGTYDADTGAVQLVKRYERPVPKDKEVHYEGFLERPSTPDEKTRLTGTWRNLFASTLGVFYCTLQS